MTLRSWIVRTNTRSESKAGHKFMISILKSLPRHASREDWSDLCSFRSVCIHPHFRPCRYTGPATQYNAKMIVLFEDAFCACALYVRVCKISLSVTLRPVPFRADFWRFLPKGYACGTPPYAYRCFETWLLGVPKSSLHVWSIHERYLCPQGPLFWPPFSVLFAWKFHFFPACSEHVSRWKTAEMVV